MNNNETIEIIKEARKAGIHVAFLLSGIILLILLLSWRFVGFSIDLLIL